jgi:hypothetical protein
MNAFFVSYFVSTVTHDFYFKNNQFLIYPEIESQDSRSWNLRIAGDKISG